MNKAILALKDIGLNTYVRANPTTPPNGVGPAQTFLSRRLDCLINELFSFAVHREYPGGQYETDPKVLQHLNSLSPDGVFVVAVFFDHGACYIGRWSTVERRVVTEEALYSQAMRLADDRRVWVGSAPPRDGVNELMQAEFEQWSGV